IGVAAALATRMAWPARPPVATTVRTTPAPHLVTEDGQGLIAVVNTGAGGGDTVARLLERELPAAEIVQAGPDDDLAKLLDEAAARARVLAVAGGDGTVNAGAQAALRHDVPLLTVPGGTLDHFSRAVGIEHPADAVTAYRAARLTRVDVGTIRQPGEDDLVFLNTASFGAYAELVDRRERLEHRIGKWPATAVAALRTFRHSEPVQVVVDGRPRRVWLAFVGNGAYGSRGPAPTWRRRLDDGRFDIRMVTTARRVPRLRALAAVLAGHLHLTPGYSHWNATSLTLGTSGGDLRVARDGETRTMTPTLEFRKWPASLAVFRMPGE
ncbi:MAG TPA: diacylglycerol kinase family protein, partial [Thermomonospora sp.]|nr:diacylglycerol kinase family protein [Thermomonospora sp.]